MKYFWIFAILLFTNPILSAFSQDNSGADDEFSSEEIKDTVSFAVHFIKGDTINYRVVSHDSIVFDFEDAYVRDRFERFQVVCDSVGTNNNFYYLSLTYTDYVSTESRGDIQDVRRTASPWTNRTVKLIIDSLGNRHGIKPDNYNLAAVSPGGAFQPYLLIGFSEHLKAVNESWYIKGVDSLYENGVPAGLFDHSTLFRASSDIDTLDNLCSQFRFVRAANGSFNMISGDESISTIAVINTGGNIMISKSLAVPIYLFQTMEQKLKVYFPDETVKTGKHYTNATFVLESINR